MPRRRRPAQMATIHVATRGPIDQATLDEVYQVIVNTLGHMSNDMEAVIEESFQAQEPIVHPKLTSRHLEHIAPLCGFRKSFVKNGENKECPICMNTFKPNRHVRKMPCNHVFCSTCISKWVCESNASCPVCREPFTSSSSRPAV